jgi:Na+/H+ antiporter NhaD/arsenite permease-like protein
VQTQSLKFLLNTMLIFMFGLSIVFLLANVMDHADEIPILEYVRKIEFDTLLFFLGILLIVDMNLNEWLGLTFAVGAGGSLLAIGSAAGVLAMSKVEGLSFIAYLKYFPNIFFAFSVGYLLVVFL